MKTRITSLFVIALAIFSANSKAQSVPSSWTSKGVGGGGAMYSPSISPFNGNNLFISCDMSPVHQSSDFGQTYSLLHYLQVEGGRNSEVQFTSNPLKVFVLRKNGNFYAPAKSYDGGTNWVNATNPTALGGAFQYHASPADTDLVVISDAHKIYFSNNENTSGYTTLLNYPATYGGHLAGVYFENKDTIYVCSHDTLIYTFNGGGSWASATAGTNGIPSTEHIVSFKGAKQGGRWVFFAVTIQANAVSKIYQTYCEDFPFYKGIYKLSQLQNSWVAIGANLPNTSDKVYVLGLAKNDTSVVYVAGQSNSAGVTLGALFTSTNSGSSFTLKFLNSGNFNLNNNITTGWLGKHVNNLAKFKWNGLNYIGGLAVDPNNSSRIIIGDGMLAHTSIDYGSNWQQAYTDVNYDNAPSVLLQESHLYKTSGLETTSAYWLDWTSPTSIFATYNDIVARRSTDGGQMWSFDIYGLDSSKINDVNMTIENVATGKMYAACGEVAGSNGDYTDARALWSKGRVSVSSDNGINWTTVKSFGCTVSSVAFDPNSVNGLYATVISAMGGNGDVYHCVDVINNPTVWTRLTAPPRTENRALQIIVLNNGDLVAVYGSRDISTTSTPSFSFSNSSGVFYSTDGGLSWADNNPSTMTKSTVNVEIDRNDPTQSTWLAFVSATGNLGGVFRTTNKGVNWTQVYNSPVLSGSFHPSLANEMYICTTKSGLVYATNTNSNSFTITPVTSYPFRNPQKVFFNPYNINEVWVTSFGNGIKMGTTNIPTAISENNFNNNEFTIYPNPTNNILNIVLSENIDVNKIIIYDVTGKEIKSVSIKINSKDIQTDVSSLPKGIYLLTLQSDKMKYSKTFIVE